MRISFVLRVDSVPLEQGQLVGEIEEVSTGRTGGLQSLEDLAGFVFDGRPGTDTDRGAGRPPAVQGDLL